MNVMLIGASDTLGTYLPDRSQGTFATLQRELPAALRTDVEVTHMRFYSHFPNAPQHALRNVQQRAPDVAVVAAQSMAFGSPSVAGRLVHLFGWKTGRWLERRIWDADRRARQGNPIGKVREPLRTLVVHTIGTATYATVDQTIGHYSETIGLLARVEQMQLLVLGTFQPRRDGATEPGVKLNAGLAKAAEAHRAPWIDRQALVDGLGPDAYQPNGLHSTPLVHRKVADAVIAAIVAGR